jgi:hypothetical protein
MPLKKALSNRRAEGRTGINLFLMKRFLFFFIISAALPYNLFASDSLPFPVSLGGQPAKDGTPFAKIEKPVAADAELSVDSKDGMIIVNVNAVNGEERTGCRLNARSDFAPGQNQNELGQNNEWKEARSRKLRHERRERRQDCQYSRDHQVAFVRAKTIRVASLTDRSAVLRSPFVRHALTLFVCVARQSRCFTKWQRCRITNHLRGGRLRQCSGRLQALLCGSVCVTAFIRMRFRICRS